MRGWAWVRTGFRFLAYADPSVAPPGVAPVCRFYARRRVSAKPDFLSASPQECADYLARFRARGSARALRRSTSRRPMPRAEAARRTTSPIYRFADNAESAASSLHARSRPPRFAHRSRRMDPGGLWPRRPTRRRCAHRAGAMPPFPLRSRQPTSKGCGGRRRRLRNRDGASVPSIRATLIFATVVHARRAQANRGGSR